MAKLLTQIIFLVAILVSTLALQPSEAATNCNKTSNLTGKKPKVVLVHGFGAGGWCWYKVRLSLESMGYNVTSIDLKGAGIDPTNISTIETFEDYNEPLDRFMAHLPQHEKIVLVGHSAGGVSLTKTLHDYPDKVHVAIYISATMLKNGYTTCEHLTMGVPYFNMSKCFASCPKLPDPTCFDKVLLPSTSEFPIGSMEDYTLAKSLVRAAPYRAVCTSKFQDKTNGNKTLSIDKVPRVYIKTLYDRTLLPEQQSAMIKLWPPCVVHEITNDHDALTSKPMLLSGLIVNASHSYGGGEY